MAPRDKHEMVSHSLCVSTELLGSEGRCMQTLPTEKQPLPVYFQSCLVFLSILWWREGRNTWEEMRECFGFCFALFVFYRGGFSSPMEGAVAHPSIPLQCTGVWQPSQHCFRCFMCPGLLDPQNKPMRLILWWIQFTHEKIKSQRGDTLYSKLHSY